MRARSPRASSRDAILRVFAEHVADRGYADTSLGDIAAELNLSKGTIVHHFGTKEALLREVHVAYFARRFAEADFILAQLKNPESRLAAMIYALLAAHRDDRAASLACLRELVRYFDGDLTGYVRTQRTRYTAIVSDILRDGVDQGLFHTADPKMSALQIFGMCNYAWTWYKPDGSESVEEIARLFARNILSGLAHGPAEDAALDELITKAIATVQRAPGRLALPINRLALPLIMHSVCLTRASGRAYGSSASAYLFAALYVANGGAIVNSLVLSGSRAALTRLNS